jgi:hypothetical protein
VDGELTQGKSAEGTLVLIRQKTEMNLFLTVCFLFVMICCYSIYVFTTAGSGIEKGKRRIVDSLPRGTGYRIVKGLIHGVKGAGRKVKVTYKNVRKA